MKKSDAQTYLNKIVYSHMVHNRNLREKEDEGISICTTDWINVYQGIELLADAAGELLNVYPRNDEQYNYEFSFTCNGVRIIQLSNTDEIPEVIWDE